MVPQLISASSLRTHSRFSMREMLLATTAVGALIALAMQSGAWLGPTPFFDRFNAFQTVRLAMADKGVQVGSIAGDRGAETAGRVSRQIFAFTLLDAQGVEPSQALDLFRERVKQDLQASGAKITGERYIGRKEGDELKRFCYLYEHNWRRGEIIVYLIPGEPGQFKATGTVHEF